MICAWLLGTAGVWAGNRIYDPQVKSLTAVVNQDWLSPTVMRLGSNDVLHVGFDELSHDYHRYIARIERCEADWTTAGEVFESDWLEGFNDNVIEDFERSINTTVLYTHYQTEIPNDRCRLKMSGNYRLHIIDEDTQEEVLKVEFMVTEQAMRLSMAATANTDIDTNLSHQQVTMGLGYAGLAVTNTEEQLRTVVMQNGREDNWRHDAKPDYITPNGLEWRHCRSLIFEGGNEYHKYETLDPSHPTMGIDHIEWVGNSSAPSVASVLRPSDESLTEGHYEAYPYVSEPRPNYLYDEDANGAFYIRNSDNFENDTSSDYLWVNFRLKVGDSFVPSVASGLRPSDKSPAATHIVLNGRWTTEHPDTYLMTYDAEEDMYKGRVLQKQGYYSYQYLYVDESGNTYPIPSEGCFYQTENRYQALVYYKETGGRTWRLVAYGQTVYR